MIADYEMQMHKRPKSIHTSPFIAQCLETRIGLDSVGIDGKGQVMINGIRLIVDPAMSHGKIEIR
jgi:hypothetical protein